MANARRLGFWPARVSGGGYVTMRKSRVLTNNTVAIFYGDGVKFGAGGDVLTCTAGADESILLASVAQGVTFVDSTNKRVEAKFLPAATTYTGTTFEPELASFAYIVDNATMVEFEANVANSAIALTDLNLNYPMVLGAGSTTTGLSAHELNATGRNTTNTLPWRVREVVRRADNDIDIVNVKVFAMINAGQAEPVTSAYTGT